ncbi:MAG: hypothetical protein ACI91B_001762 [Planctomycetota bacterium]|jgi:hypothetical protein
MTRMHWRSVVAALLVGLSLPGQELSSSVTQDPVHATGTVEGIVRGQDGEPMRNVEVFAATAYFGGEELARSRTDGFGMFVLGRLPSTVCHVFARAPGTTTATAPALLSADNPHVAVNLRVYEANTIRGRVVDGGGKAIAGAMVMGTKEGARWSGGLQQAETHTDADGRFELPGVPIGLSVFRIWKPGYALRPYWLTTSEDAELAVTLGRNRGMQFHITTEGLSKEAVAAVRVSIRASQGYSGFALPSDLARGSLNALGGLELWGLPRAKWHVSLSHPKFFMHPKEISTEPDDRNRTMHFVGSASGGAVVRGTLVDSKGKPLAKQELLLHRYNVSLRTATDEHGRFSMSTTLADGDNFRLSLVGSGYVFSQDKHEGMDGFRSPYRWAQWEASAGPNREIALVAEPAVRVTGTLVDASGAPMQLVPAQLQINHGGRWGLLASATTRRDGTVQFPGVQATEDECRIFVSSAGVGDCLLPQLRAGVQKGIRAVFSSPGVVKGQLLDLQGEPVVGESVLLGDYATDNGKGTANMNTWVPTDRQGRFVFPTVAPGYHFLGTEDLLNGVQLVAESGKTVVVNLTAK